MSDSLLAAVIADDASVMWFRSRSEVEYLIIALSVRMVGHLLPMLLWNIGSTSMSRVDIGMTGTVGGDRAGL